MKKLMYAVIAIFSIAFITVSCKKDVKKEKKEIKIEKQEMHNHNKMANAVYQCPMDCEHGKTYEKEGNCPVCNMKLKKVENSKKTDAKADSTKISSNLNCKYCKGKMACKSNMACKGKMNCKSEKAANKKNCKNCNSGKSICKSSADSSNKECAKCNTKNCKGSCKGKA